MTKPIFVFKELNSDDRDIVNYIKRSTFDCDHYFGCINLTGACFSKGLNFPKDIKTILSKKEISILIKADKDLNSLGYSIKKYSLRYKKGLKILNNIEPIFKKLESEENKNLFKEIIQEEKDHLKINFDLNDKEIQEIFDSYSLEYKDRAIVGRVYADRDKLAEEEAENYIENFQQVERYFNYEDFASDLLDGENYIELSTGKCVALCY